MTKPVPSNAKYPCVAITNSLPIPAVTAASPAIASVPIIAAPCVPIKLSIASAVPLVASQAFSPRLKFESSPSSTHLSTYSATNLPICLYGSLISFIPIFSSMYAKT